MLSAMNIIVASQLLLVRTELNFMFDVIDTNIHVGPILIIQQKVLLQYATPPPLIQ